MCIRDSVYFVCWLCKLEFNKNNIKNNNNSNDVKSNINNVLAFKTYFIQKVETSRLHRETIGPVSYTHLDVYKRQTRR